MTGTILLTGANGSLGLGFVSALLASHPTYTLLATVRNPSPQTDPNTAKLHALLAKHPNSRVVIEPLDLASLSDVRCFADRLATTISQSKLPRLSAIVCNAFTWSLTGQQTTPDGLEATFQVSHLSHVLLVLKLLGSMDARVGRVVMLGSVAHYPEKPMALSKLQAGIPGDLEVMVRPGDDERGREHDMGWQRYGNAKLAGVVFMRDLNRRLLAVSIAHYHFTQNPKLSSITVTCMDPGGLVGSRAHSEQRPGVRRMFGAMNLMMPVLRHVTSAVRTTADSGRDLVALTVGPEFRGKRGYFDGRKEVAPAEVSGDREVQKMLWAACWRWAGLSQEETVLEQAAAL